MFSDCHLIHTFLSSVIVQETDLTIYTQPHQIYQIFQILRSVRFSSTVNIMLVLRKVPDTENKCIGLSILGL